MNRRDALKWMGSAAALLWASSDPLPATAQMAEDKRQQASGSIDAALTFATAAQTAEAIKTGKISAREMLELTFRRIDLYNPGLNAIVWQDREAAAARARQADEALARGAAPGPLHGVPITIKEAFAYRGSPSTWGVPALKNALSPRTAVAIERLESAGAIVVGKTNVPLMLSDLQSYNAVYGTTNNPWDLKLTPGGSTGGGAAAVAAGLSYLTAGSDLGGSIRIPAHFCAVYGHKPSLNLVTMEGFQPGPWNGSPNYPEDIAVAGPLARSASDLRLCLEVMGGPNGTESRAWSWKMPPPRRNRIRDFRIGYVLDDPADPVDPDVAAVYEKALGAIGKTGARMERGWPPGADSAAHLDTFYYLVLALVTADLPQEARAQMKARARDNPNGVAAIEETAASAPHSRWLHESARRLGYRALWQKYFDTHDVFVLPTAITAAFPHDHSEPPEDRVIATSTGKRPYLPAMSFWMSFAGLAGLPATVAPVGFTRAGLPVGIQIIAPMWEDGTSIEFARLLSEIASGFVPPPGYGAS